MSLAFDEMNCKNCEYMSSCELRKIAPDLYGCMGHGKLHHRFAEQAAREEALFSQKRKEALLLSEQQADNFSVGDVVQLQGSTIALGLTLPRYLDNGCFTVIGKTRTGKIKCDWDGGKPFNIPPLCLKKIESGVNL